MSKCNFFILFLSNLLKDLTLLIKNKSTNNINTKHIIIKNKKIKKNRLVKGLSNAEKYEN